MIPDNQMHLSNGVPSMNRRPRNWMQRIRHLFEILKAFALCAPLFLVTGCQPESSLDDGPDEVLFFESIGLGHYGSTREPIESVLRDQASFDKAISELTPLDDLPAVDFDQTMVGLIAVPTESGGYIIEVQSVEKTGEELAVHYRLSAPGDDCITPQALALPFQVVIIAKTTGNVSFVRETVTYRCGL